MRRRKITAIVLTCCMLVGQTTWAQEVDTKTIVMEQEYVETTEHQEAQKEWQEVQEEQKEEGIPVTPTEIISETDPDMDGKEENVQEKGVDQGSGENFLEEQSAEAQNDMINKRSICINYPIRIPVGSSLPAGKGLEAYEIESENEDICEVTGGIYQMPNGMNNVYITLNGIRKGTTIVNVVYSPDNNTRSETKFEITVNELPEDAVIFPDIVLRSCLAESVNDSNEDGCISKSELEKIESISTAGFFGGSIKELSGLEGAVHLQYLDLGNNTELSDISTLANLKNLQYVNLEGTKVSDADRWKLADFKDCTLPMGEKIYVPALLGLFGEELSVEAVSNAKCVEIQRMDYNGAVEVLAKEPGEPKLHISYKDLNTDIVLTIQGILADQEVGEDYPVEIESIGSISSSAFDLDTALILDSNHQLWELYPEVVKKKDNVKAYVANWVYYGPGRKDAEVCTYLLDNNKILWNDTEKLAANVERFDGRYALDTQGVLHNVYNSGNEQIENVEDWSSPTYLDKGIVYILKKDGTLWKRQETARDQKAGQWEKVDSGVKQLYKINHYSLDGGYLKTDGTIVAFDGTETTDIKADHMGEKGSFYDKEGNYYFYDWEEYINLGKIDVKQAKLCRGSEEIILLLDQAGKAYKYDVQTKKQELLATDVMKINENFSYWPESTAWAFQLTNGKYCDGNGNAMKEAKIGSSGYSYSLIWHDDGSQEVVRNGVPILSKVTAVWGERIEGEWITFACRTDGTVWNITGVPKLVLDLKTSTYIKGDVNEDREVNIKDLQIVLRGVCEKIELTARQKMIADVVEDGEVDIQDLRKELRFVCGKIESL